MKVLRANFPLVLLAALHALAACDAGSPQDGLIDDAHIRGTLGEVADLDLAATGVLTGVGDAEEPTRDEVVIEAVEGERLARIELVVWGFLSHPAFTPGASFTFDNAGEPLSDASDLGLLVLSRGRSIASDLEAHKNHEQLDLPGLTVSKGPPGYRYDFDEAALETTVALVEEVDGERSWVVTLLFGDGASANASFWTLQPHE